MGPFTRMMYLQFEASYSQLCLTQRKAVLCNDPKELHPKLHCRGSAAGLDEKKTAEGNEKGWRGHRGLTESSS